MEKNMQQLDLRQNENVTITTRDQSTYEAVVISSDTQALFINLNGFGRLSIPWSSIEDVEKRPVKTNAMTFRLKSLKEKTVVSL